MIIILHYTVHGYRDMNPYFVVSNTKLPLNMLANDLSNPIGQL